MKREKHAGGSLKVIPQIVMKDKDFPAPFRDH